MSDYWIRFIPADAQFMPGPERVADACALAESFFETHDQVTTESYDVPVFIDAGENLGGVTCPACRGALDDDWWQNLLHPESGEPPSLRDVTMPCCARTVSMADLQFDWPVGFARFVLDVMNPVGDLEDAHVALLSSTLRTPLRVIYQHI